nr:unnamed protein product [Digitaria exilis]
MRPAARKREAAAPEPRSSWKGRRRGCSHRRSDYEARRLHACLLRACCLAYRIIVVRLLPIRAGPPADHLGLGLEARPALDRTERRRKEAEERVASFGGERASERWCCAGLAAQLYRRIWGLTGRD